jgi:UDPglucose 6-dehydrogenase
LLENKAKVSVFDPEAMENTKNIFGKSVEYVDRMYNCLDNADALIICTEWNIFRTPDFSIIKNKLKHNIIFDGRNLFNPDDMENINIEYYSVGRRTVSV